MLNRIIIMGNLTRDPDLRYTQAQTAVTSFTLAVERDRAGEGEQRSADFIDCVAWRSSAEFVSRNFHKGDRACVSGRLQLRDWTDKEGNKKRNAEVIVENIYFCEKKNYQTAAPQQYEDISDEDLPF